MSDAILGKHHFLSRLRAGKIDEKTETTYLKTNIALKFKVLQIKINLHEQELHMEAIIIRNYFKNTAGNTVDYPPRRPYASLKARSLSYLIAVP